MGEEDKNISINFSLASFSIISYEFIEPDKNFDLESFGFKIRFKPTVDLSNEIVSILIQVQGHHGKDGPEALGRIETSTSYSITDIEKLINNEGDFILPKGMAITFLSIAVSTTRGALAAKSEDKPYSEAILPLVDPKNLYENSPLKGALDTEAS